MIVYKLELIEPKIDNFPIYYFEDLKTCKQVERETINYGLNKWKATQMETLHPHTIKIADAFLNYGYATALHHQNKKK